MANRFIEKFDQLADKHGLQILGTLTLILGALSVIGYAIYTFSR